MYLFPFEFYLYLLTLINIIKIIILFTLQGFLPSICRFYDKFCLRKCPAVIVVCTQLHKKFVNMWTHKCITYVITVHFMNYKLFFFTKPKPSRLKICIVLFATKAFSPTYQYHISNNENITIYTVSAKTTASKLSVCGS